MGYSPSRLLHLRVNTGSLLARLSTEKKGQDEGWVVGLGTNENGAPSRGD